MSDLLPTGAVMRRLNLSRPTILRYAQQGYLPVAVKLPTGRLFFRASVVEAFAAQITQDAAPAHDAKGAA